MFYLTKSKYCELWQCPKILWLQKYKPEEFEVDESDLSRMEAGSEVGDLAMELFGDYVETTSYIGEKLDIPAMIAKTRDEMAKGRQVICEASFNFKGLSCIVDILKKDDYGWAIYEVKSSTDYEEPVYLADVAYQKYVLEKCGIRVSNTYLVYINKDYIFDGTLDIQKLFVIADVSEAVAIEEKNIDANISVAKRLLNSAEEPDIDLSINCKSPYNCGFWNYCSKHLTSPSVFDLYRMRLSKKFEYYYKGQASYEDLISNGNITNEKQLRQMEYALEDKGTYIEKDNIRHFLNTLSYPLYFLDFETMLPVIPEFIGTRPYEQIPFQYSLHYINGENGMLRHKEFLAEVGIDPRRALAEQLCNDIPMNVCVTAYNKSFECNVLKRLAEAFPDLADHLLNISENIQDLLVPFQSGWYYNRAMGGSFSIKSVLPAIFPNDPELDYQSLEGVRSGSDAMNLFPKTQYMEPAEQAVARKNLLKYCELDTYAMVKIWQELVQVTK